MMHDRMMRLSAWAALVLVLVATLPARPSFAQAGNSPLPAARLEPFDSYWQAPKDVEKGFTSFTAYYRANYLDHMPADKQARILVISCGPGYLVKMLRDCGYSSVLGIDSDPVAIAIAKANASKTRVKAEFRIGDVSEVHEAVDTVLMNPPFGAQSRHADRPGRLGKWRGMGRRSHQHRDPVPPASLRGRSAQRSRPGLEAGWTADRRKTHGLEPR